MTDVDHKIRQVLAELVDMAPMADGPPPDSRRTQTAGVNRVKGRVALAVVLGLVVLGLIGVSQRSTNGAGTVEHGNDDAGESAPATEDALLTSPLGDDDWPLPRLVPDGFEYDHAMSAIDQRRIVFSNSAANSSMSITTPSGDEDYVLVDRDDSTLTIGSDTWRRTMNGSWLRLADGVQVWGEIPNRDLEAFLGSIEVVDTTALPRPPLDVQPDSPLYEAVATTTIGNETRTLSVMTDGVYYAIRHGDGGGCCARLTAGRNVAISGGSGPVQLGDNDQIEPVGFLHGLVDESVTAIEVHLKDGTIIETTPQDLNSAFPVNFFFVTLTVNDDPFDILEAVLVFDEANNQIGRADQL